MRPQADATGRCSVQSAPMNWVPRAAVALIAVQLLIRSVLAFGGDFYWDDLILVGRAGTNSLLS
ncbi:MAG: hypothetical protein ACSLFA_28455, partial [Mycobacterium sp.]